MPVLDIEGQHVTVDDSFLNLSHDQQNATVNEIASSLKPQGSSLAGTAKQLGYGLVQGITGLAGLPADLAHLYAPNQSDPNPLGSEALTKKVLGDVPAPQGTIEGIANKVGQFAPMVLGGPESLAAKAATRVTAPAVASEIGKEVAGPYGEVAGALVGGVGATTAARKFQEVAAARQAAKAVPSAEDLLKTAGDQFNQARDMNLVVKPDFAMNAANDMRDAIKGFDPEAHKPVFAAADRLEGLGSSSPGLPPTAVPMNEVENIRKQLVSLKTSPDASVREAARKAITSLQDSQKAITAADVLSGDAPAYSKLVSDATGNWAAGKRSNTVMGKANLAQLNADTAGSGANVDNAYRQAIKQLVRPINNDIVPKAQRLGFNNQEIDALNTAARGTTTGNIARYIGKGAPTGIVSAAGGLGVGHLAGGPLGAVAVPAVGYLAKKIGDLSTKRAVSAVDSLVRSRSPLAAQVAQQLPPQIVAQLPAKTQRILQGLIATDKVISQQRQPIGQPNAQ